MSLTSPRVLLHLEGLFVLITGCSLYAYLHFSWITFALFILAPDIFMLGYLANKRVGALCYNFAHTYSVPLLIFLALFCLERPGYYWIVLIWIAHIGLDRLLGYGIKYETAFKDTHLQRV